VTAQVPGIVMGAVLLAALMHGSWNALVKSRSDALLVACGAVAMRLA